MRRILTGFVVAAVTAIAPALAMAGNQEVAEQIARNLRKSGQMSDYRIGVKFQDGTVWLRGQVSSQEQMEKALSLVSQTPGVHRVVNGLTTAQSSVNPPREEPAAETVQKPKPISLAKRMEALISRSSQPAPVEEPVVPADRVSNTFAAEKVETVSAEEPQAIFAPQRARPMTREPARVAMTQQGAYQAAPNAAPRPMYTAARACPAPARYDQPCLPNYAWPSYAAYPNYASVTYPKQYSPTAWPYIGPFYPYPQVPMGWRKVTLEWDSGWWFLDFKDQPASCWQR